MFSRRAPAERTPCHRLRDRKTNAEIFGMYGCHELLKHMGVRYLPGRAARGRSPRRLESGCAKRQPEKRLAGKQPGLGNPEKQSESMDKSRSAESERSTKRRREEQKEKEEGEIPSRSSKSSARSKALSMSKSHAKGNFLSRRKSRSRSHSSRAKPVEEGEMV